MHGDVAKHTTRKFRQVIAVPGLEVPSLPRSLDGHTEQMNQTSRSSHKVLRLKSLHKTLLREDRDHIIQNSIAILTEDCG